MFSLNAEAQAAQKLLDGIRDKIEKETVWLLSSQKDRLDALYTLFVAEKKQQEDTIDYLKLEVGKLKTSKQTLSSTIDEMDATTRIAKSELLSINEKITVVDDHAKAQEQRVLAFTGQQKELEQSISLLDTRKNDLLGEVEELEGQLAEKKQSVAIQIDVLDASIEEKQRTMTVLDTKLVEIKQEMELQQAKDSLTRSSLADWQKTLEERDRNLRIRELKVEQGEGRLTQNADLLNL